MADVQVQQPGPDRAEDKKFAADHKLPVGLPEPAIWTGDAGAEADARRPSSTPTCRADNYQPFIDGSAAVPIKLEPPNAQQIYAVLDVAMQKVLTDKNANIDELLADAEKQVNAILASAK